MWQRGLRIGIGGTTELVWGIRFLCLALLAPFRFLVFLGHVIWGTPRNIYLKSVRFRDWLLAKVAYLQEESEKWRRIFQILKSPYSVLRAMGFSPQMAGTMLFASTAVTSSVVVNEVLEGKSFSAGDAGIYTAPSDTPIEWSDQDNTLRIDLGSVPVGEISISDVTVGTAYTGSALPSGETNVIVIGGLPATSDPVFAETYLEVGHLIVDRWRCTKFSVSNVEAHTLNVKYNASDGQSIAPIPGTPRARGIGGGNRADKMETKGGLYDQIKITAPNSGVNGKVDVLYLSNLYTKGGPCVLSRIKAGILDITYLEVGNGDGFAAKDFEITGTTTYKTFSNVDNVEVSISPPS
tara:strand:+ start:149 stop:1201 length:1053 start_codon:yes stop_codon:yes gene_type:complete